MTIIIVCIAFLGLCAGFAIAAFLAAGAQADHCADCLLDKQQWAELVALLAPKGYRLLTPTLLASLLPELKTPISE